MQQQTVIRALKHGLVGGAISSVAAFGLLSAYPQYPSVVWGGGGMNLPAIALGPVAAGIAGGSVTIAVILLLEHVADVDLRKRRHGEQRRRFRRLRTRRAKW